MKKVTLVGICLALLVIVLDQWSKWWVYHELSPLASKYWEYPYGGLPVFQNWLGVSFAIVKTTNTGAAWGSFSDLQIPLLIFRIILIFGVCLYLFFCRTPSVVIPLCLLLGGAISNVIDTFHYGTVIDMFKFVLWGYHYPVFNIADAAIVTGIGWIIIKSFMHDKITTKNVSSK